MEPEEIINAGLADFSSYDGERQLYNENVFGSENSAAYTGEGDPFLDFGGVAKRFSDSIKKGRIYTINLLNKFTVDATIVLSPGLQGLFGYDTQGVPGLMKTGQFVPVEGTAAGFDATDVNKSIVGSGKHGSLELFIAYIQQNPTMIAGLKISATSALQIEQNFTIEEQSPFKSLGDRTIFVSAHTDETANKDKVATVDEQFQLDHNTRLAYLLLAGTGVVLTLFCAASLSTPKALKEKGNRAARAINRMGGAAQVNAALSLKK